MRWPPPKNLRDPSDVTPLSRCVAGLRIPLGRHAFVALFEQVARRDEALARLVAAELTEAARQYRQVVYSTAASTGRQAASRSRWARRDALRRNLRTIRRLDLRRGKTGASHDWLVILSVGRRVHALITEWLADGRKTQTRAAFAKIIVKQLSRLARPVTVERVSQVLAGGRKAKSLTARLLALAVYGRTGTPRHILDGINAIIDRDTKWRGRTSTKQNPFQTRRPKMLSLP